MRARPASRVIYVATGERHIKEAGHSLRSLWRHEPWLPVTMYIDGPSRLHLGSWKIPDPPGDDLLQILEHPAPTYSWADKPVALAERVAEGDRLLFLDTDTRVCGGIMEVFEVLDAFELAAAHAPIRLGPRQPTALSSRAPVAFPELNTGVIAFRATETVRQLLERWRSLHRDILQSSDQGSVGDQATLRVALYESEVRFAVLPPEYNCRFTFPTYLHGPVRILHGRASDLEAVEREVNETTGPRVFVPGVGVVSASRM